jgi:succinyl-CoA:acetate CoA-transferase
MDGIEARIRHKESLAKVMTADQAALLFRDGMMVATSGNPLMGYPGAMFQALSERIKREGGIKVDLLCAGPVGAEVEDVLAEVGGIRTRIGAIGGEKLRAAINRGEVRFLEGKGGQLPLMVKRGLFGRVDMAVVEAIGLTPEGSIIPSTAVYDSPEWLDAAEGVIVEINLNRPLSLEGLHDVYQKGSEPIPITGNPLKRIGVPYFPVDPKKIRAIVVSQRPERPSGEGKPDRSGDVIAGHLLAFFRREIAAGRMSDPLPPIELGVGELAAQVMRSIGTSPFTRFRFHLPAITDPVMEIIEAGKVEWVSGMALRLTAAAWARFTADLDRYKKLMVLRPVSICNSAEVIQRLGVIAINGCLEMDIQGQVNSSHVLGTKILGGIAGSYDFSRNAAYSIFVGPSTARGGKISAIVPMVSHVDHTEHDVDILVTEQGLADLRGLDPIVRAETIIRQCAHPDYRELLSAYLAHARKEPGHIPVSLEEAHSFHLRLKQTGSMKADG